jgi:hypothetical protein
MMKGFPKYEVGDTVTFVSEDVINREGEVVIPSQYVTGVIEIVDEDGTFDTDDVSYDIFEEERNMLWKHVEEKFILQVQPKQPN